MSVIGRMLRDLEARKAQPGAGSNARTLKPGPDRARGRKRRRGVGQHVIALALAVVLTAVAAVLWWQRAPELRAGLAQAAARVATLGDAPRAGPTGSGEAAAAATQAKPSSEPQPEQPSARLVAARFTGVGNEAALELRVEGELLGEPGYTRQGVAVSLRVPANATRLEMPAPPADQGVFKSVTLQADDERGATLRLRVAEDARFDLARSAEGLTLDGRLPAAPEANPDRQAGASATGQSGAAGKPQTAAGENEPAAPKEQATGASAEDEPAPAASAIATADRSASAETRSTHVAGASPGAADDRGDEQTTRGGSSESASTGDGSAAMQKTDRSSPSVRAKRRYREARSAISAGDLGRARELLAAALELDPGLHRARDLLVALYRRAGQDDAARDVLAEGVERAPARAAYAKPYARLLVDAGDLERAAQVLADAARAAGNDAEFHALAAAVAQRRGRHEAAASAYTRALELDAGNGRWWLGLGVSLAAYGHPGEAAAAFREARRTGSLTPRLDAWARGRIQALQADSG